jgi:hypothetical protein
MGGNSYDDPAAIVAGTVVMQVVSTLCVGLRFYSRRWKHQSCIVSDWLILAAWVFGTGLSILMIYGSLLLLLLKDSHELTLVQGYHRKQWPTR